MFKSLLFLLRVLKIPGNFFCPHKCPVRGMMCCSSYCLASDLPLMSKLFTSGTFIFPALLFKASTMTASSDQSFSWFISTIIFLSQDAPLYHFGTTLPCARKLITHLSGRPWQHSSLSTCKTKLELRNYYLEYIIQPWSITSSLYLYIKTRHHKSLPIYCCASYGSCVVHGAPSFYDEPQLFFGR